MMMNIVALAAEAESNVFSKAGIVSLMGMATIFMVLALLWGAIEIMHLLLHRGEKKAKAEKPAAVTPTAPVEPAPAPVSSEDDGAIVAAITAAITAMRAEDGVSGAFRVVSFKRVGKSAARR